MIINADVCGAEMISTLLVGVISIQTIEKHSLWMTPQII